MFHLLFFNLPLMTPFCRIKILLLCFWAQTQEYFVGGCWLILWCGPKPNQRHWPREIGLPSSFLIPRFMGLGFTNSVQIRAGIDYTALVQSLERALTFIGLLEERRIWERVARPLQSSLDTQGMLLSIAQIWWVLSWPLDFLRIAKAGDFCWKLD